MGMINWSLIRVYVAYSRQSRAQCCPVLSSSCWRSPQQWVKIYKHNTAHGTMEWSITHHNNYTNYWLRYTVTIKETLSGIKLPLLKALRILGRKGDIITFVFTSTRWKMSPMLYNFSWVVSGRIRKKNALSEGTSTYHKTENEGKIFVLALHKNFVNSSQAAIAGTSWEGNCLQVWWNWRWDIKCCPDFTFNFVTFSWVARTGISMEGETAPLRLPWSMMELGTRWKMPLDLI